MKYEQKEVRFNEFLHKICQDYALDNVYDSINIFSHCSYQCLKYVFSQQADQWVGDLPVLKVAGPHFSKFKFF